MNKENKTSFAEILQNDLCKECCKECEFEECPLRENDKKIVRSMRKC